LHIVKAALTLVPSSFMISPIVYQHALGYQSKVPLRPILDLHSGNILSLAHVLSSTIRLADSLCQSLNKVKQTP
jgi:hypothetical protein